MKRFLLPFLLIFIFDIAVGQTVENIRVEQDGDKLMIHYRIGGSTSDELYDVTLTCSIDEGPAFEPRAVIGDVGSNIRGGKSFNTIVWDVFEDVEEIGSVEFFVKVDLEKEDGGKVEDEKVVDKGSVMLDQEQEKRKFFAGYNGSSLHPLGIRAGTLGNWGFYAGFRYGGWDPYYYVDFWGNWVGNYLVSVTGGVTKEIKAWEKFRLHGFTGIGAGYYLDEFEFEIGAIGVIKNRVNVNLGFSYFSYLYDVTIGVGVVF